MKNFERLTIFGSAFILSAFSSMGIAIAATYWVATTGSDSNSCTSVSGESDPGRYKRTIAAGIACMVGSGHTVLIKDGIYTETNQFNSPPPGISWASPNVIKAQNNRKVIYEPPSSNSNGHGIELKSNRRFIRFQGIVLNGVNLSSNGIKTMGSTDLEFIDFQIKSLTGASGVAIDKVSSRIRFAGCSIHDITEPKPRDPGAHGFYVRGTFNIIEHCELYNIQGYGVQLYEQTANASNYNTVRYNTIHNVGQLNPPRNGGIVIGTGTGHKVYGNVVYNNPLNGIVARSAGNEVYNNTIYNNPGRGLELTGSNYSVKNNIVFNNGTNIKDTGSNNAQSNNLTTDPMFADATEGNFRLKSGSPAIDKGVAISAVSEDPDGTPRPQGGTYDIGAYEYRQTTTTTISPP